MQAVQPGSSMEQRWERAWAKGVPQPVCLSGRDVGGSGQPQMKLTTATQAVLERDSWFDMHAYMHTLR